MFRDVFGKSICLLTVVGIALTALEYFFPYLNRIGFYLSVYEVVFYGLVARRADGVEKVISLALIGFACLLTFYSSLASNGQGTMPYSIVSLSELFL